VNLLLGGPIIAGATLSRFFALHVFVVPGLLIAFVVVHLILVLALGINEWPTPGRVVRRATYLEEYHRLTHGGDGIPFVPAAVWKDIFFSGFTHLSGHAPWSPVMDAWSGEPIPAHYLKGRSALERQGALVFQVKQCHNCHALDEHGGQRGPTLDAVAVRLTHDQLIRQVIQGG